MRDEFHKNVTNMVKVENFDIDKPGQLGFTEKDRTLIKFLFVDEDDAISWLNPRSDMVRIQKIPMKLPHGGHCVAVFLSSLDGITDL